MSNPMQNLDQLLQAERDKTNQEWIAAFDASGLRRPKSLKPSAVVDDVRWLMLLEFNRRNKEVNALLHLHDIKEPQKRSRPFFRWLWVL